jgi:phosphoribosylformimino-5-aminoimidazole carboxamide ribonucleotide (ProFAR) isomerase
MDVYGAIVGKAIYAGSLDLLEAINYTRDIAKGEEE